LATLKLLGVDIRNVQKLDLERGKIKLPSKLLNFDPLTTNFASWWYASFLKMSISTTTMAMIFIVPLVIASKIIALDF